MEDYSLYIKKHVIEYKTLFNKNYPIFYINQNNLNILECNILSIQNYYDNISCLYSIESVIKFIELCFKLNCMIIFIS